MSGITDLIAIMNKPDSELTDEERQQLTQVAYALQEQQKVAAETMVTQLKAKATPLLEELKDVKKAISELNDHEQVKQLIALKEELKEKNKALKEFKDSSAVCKILTETTKTERSLTTQLRKIQKEVKSLGGEFKIPTNRKGRKKKTSESDDNVASKRKRADVDDEPVAASPQELPPSPKNARATDDVEEI